MELFFLMLGINFFNLNTYTLNSNTENTSQKAFINFTREIMPH